MDKLVFVCSEFASDPFVNIEKARDYCKYVISNGHKPFAPHLLYPKILNDDIQEQRELGIECGVTVLTLACKELWFFTNKQGTISSGMKQEIETARKLGIHVIDKTIDYNFQKNILGKRW